MKRWRNLPVQSLRNRRTIGILVFFLLVSLLPVSILVFQTDQSRNYYLSDYYHLQDTLDTIPNDLSESLSDIASAVITYSEFKLNDHDLDRGFSTLWDNRIKESLQKFASQVPENEKPSISKLTNALNLYIEDKSSLQQSIGKDSSYESFNDSYKSYLKLQEDAFDLNMELSNAKQSLYYDFEQKLDQQQQQQQQHQQARERYSVFFFIFLGPIFALFIRFDSFMTDAMIVAAKKERSPAWPEDA